MGIFDFFKKNDELEAGIRTRYLYVNSEGKLDLFENLQPHLKKQGYTYLGIVPTEHYLQDKKGRKQGNFQYLHYGVTAEKLLPNQTKVCETPDGKTVFRYVGAKGKCRNGELKILHTYNEDGSVGDYARWCDENGRYHSTHTFNADLKARVDAVKLEKELDAEGRSNTLKAVLAAGNKQEKKKILKDFHAQNSPARVKRRSAMFK